MQTKPALLGALFLEILCLLGGVAFFAGRHNAHLDELQKQLAVIERQSNATQVVLTDFFAKEKEIANARLDTDKKLLDAQDFDGVLRYEFYDRLLREDACRRAGGGEAPNGAADSVR